MLTEAAGATRPGVIDLVFGSMDASCMAATKIALPASGDSATLVTVPFSCK
jgi:hypothetical protein